MRLEARTRKEAGRGTKDDGGGKGMDRGREKNRWTRDDRCAGMRDDGKARGRRTEIGSQGPEVGCQRSEDRDHRAEVGCQMSEGRGREKNRWTRDDRFAWKRDEREQEVRCRKSERASKSKGRGRKSMLKEDRIECFGR